MPVQSDTLKIILELENAGAFGSGLSRIGDLFGFLDRRVASSSRAMLAWGVGAGFAAYGATKALSAMVQEAGKLEQIRIGFTTILGSAEAADRKLSELKMFARRTPYDFEGTAKMARQLAAMGVPANELIPTMTSLGDAIAALGLGEDSLQRVVFNFGQIHTIGKLTTRELRDFAMNGIPVFDILREKLGLTAEQMNQIGRRNIPAAVGLKAIVEGMNERYGGAMAKQNETLIGQWHQMGDTAQQLAQGLGGPLASGFNFVFHVVNAGLDIMNKMPDWLKGGLGIALGVATIALITFSIKMGIAAFNTAKAIPDLVRSAQTHFDNATAIGAHAAALENLARVQGVSGAGGIQLLEGVGVAGVTTPAQQAQTLAALKARRAVREAEDAFAAERQFGPVIPTHIANYRRDAMLAEMGYATGGPMTMGGTYGASAAGGGFGSRFSGLYGKMGGARGLSVLAMLGGTGISAMSQGNPYGEAIGGALSGAGTGAMIGSFIPGMGSLVGAGIGGLLGALATYFNLESKKATQNTDPVVAKLQELLDQSKKHTEETRGVRGALSGKDVALAYQQAISMDMIVP